MTEAEWLTEHYVKQGKSAAQIANELHVSSQTVLNRLKKAGISARPKTHRTRSFASKVCERCEGKYVPYSPAQRFCDKPECAAPTVVCESCGASFQLALPKNRKQTSWKRRFCDNCVGAARSHPAAPLGETFICRRCGDEKPVSESVKDASRARGIMEVCTACETRRSSERRADPELAEEQRARVRKSQRKHRYKIRGVSEEDYWALYEEQDGKCAICQLPLADDGSYERFCYDHDHYSLKGRGLLHHWCNLLLGHARDAEHPEGDSIEVLKSAIAYLEYWQQRGDITGVREVDEDGSQQAQGVGEAR